MINLKVVFNEAKDKIQNLIEGIKFIANTEVVVGIPEESGDARNAGLLYLHENGSPGGRIPPRPVMRIGLTEVEGEMKALLRQGKIKALLGDVDSAMECYERAGQIGAESVKSVFGTEALVPNAPATVAKKGFNAPLIETGQLQGAITYVVRTK